MWLWNWKKSLHSGTEEIAIPLIKELRQERLDFLEDETSVSYFYHFIGHQYFRTQQTARASQTDSGFIRNADMTSVTSITCSVTAMVKTSEAACSLIGKGWE